jgi:hypothetical protein
MKFAATITRSLQAGMQAELRELERAVASATREAGQNLKTDLRRQGWERRARPAARQQLAGQALSEPAARRREPGLYEGAADHARIRRRRGDPEQAWTLFLAIPTENAPRKGTDDRRISPSALPEQRFGPLRFVPRSNGPSLLVVDGLRGSFSRQTGERASGVPPIGRGAAARV